MITIINYGIGNLGSIFNMFDYLGIESKIENDPDKILKAKKILLPGVGSFDAAMIKINETKDLKDVLNEKVLIEGTPILGICLGMQLMTSSSEEGNLDGFNWIPAQTKIFSKKKNLKVPHMGWNDVNISTPSVLTKGLSDNSRYYFVHSYYVHVENPNHSILKTNYDVNFDSGIAYKNIFGLQFHPEKSHTFGMEILKNFSEI